MADVPVDVTLALDVSATVRGELLDGLRPAVRQTVGALASHDRLRLFTFSHRIQRVMDFTDEPSAAETAFARSGIGGGSAAFDTIALALGSASRPGRRQLAIVVTMARDTHSLLDLDALAGLARRAETVLFVVPPQPVRLFDAVTGPTGGRVVASTTTGVAQAIVRSIGDFKGRYVLRFTPDAVPAGWHTLTIRLKREGEYSVTARTGFFAD